MLIDGHEFELPKADEQLIQASDQESYTRIELLEKYHFQELARDESGWSPLLQDPDGCYWVKEFPHASYHGGGRPVLRRLSKDEAIEIFGSDWL